MCRVFSQEKQNEIERAIAAQLGLLGEHEPENREGAARVAGAIQGIDTAQGGNVPLHTDASQNSAASQHANAAQHTDATEKFKEEPAW